MAQQRPATHAQRQLRDEDGEVPALLEQTRSSGVDELGEASGRLDYRIEHDRDVPVHARVALRELLDELGGELCDRLFLEPRRSDQAEPEACPRLRRALGLRLSPAEPQVFDLR